MTNKKKTKFAKFYKRNYKKFMLIPIVMLLVSIYFIYVTVQIDGTPIYRDISLKGGLSAIITINTTKTITQVQNNFQNEFKNYSFSVSQTSNNGVNTGFIIDTDLKEDQFKPYAEKYFNTTFTFGKNYNSNYISPSLSSAFFLQTIKILIFSFVLMSVVIFAYFREFYPSFAVILSAAFDILVTIGVLDLMKVKISIAGIGAILMLIGYSIDTDVLLTNRLIREPGENYFEKTFVAFKTGILMSLTTLFAGVAALLITNSSTIYEIALILVIGLVIDIISTWLQNAGILLWWLEKKSK